MKRNLLQKFFRGILNIFTKSQYGTPIPKILENFFESGKAFEPGQATLFDEWLKIPELRKFITAVEDNDGYIIEFQVHDWESYDKAKQAILRNPRGRKIVSVSCHS